MEDGRAGWQPRVWRETHEERGAGRAIGVAGAGLRRGAGADAARKGAAHGGSVYVAQAGFRCV